MDGYLVGIIVLIFVWLIGISLNLNLTDERVSTLKDRFNYFSNTNHEDIENLNDFIKRNCPPCPECGESGLDCHNYQG